VVHVLFAGKGFGRESVTRWGRIEVGWVGDVIGGRCC